MFGFEWVGWVQLRQGKKPFIRTESGQVHWILMYLVWKQQFFGSDHWILPFVVHARWWVFLQRAQGCYLVFDRHDFAKWPENLLGEYKTLFKKGIQLCVSACSCHPTLAGWSRLVTEFGVRPHRQKKQQKAQEKGASKINNSARSSQRRCNVYVVQTWMTFLIQQTFKADYL